MSNIIDPRARQIITNANGDIIQNTLSDIPNALPTPLPATLPTSMPTTAQDFRNPPASAEGDKGGGYESQDTTQALAQNPLQTQTEQTRYARDIDSTHPLTPSAKGGGNKEDSSANEYKRPTLTKTYSLNKYIINDIDADNAEQALDLLRNTPTNISWEGVDNALKNGISANQILERFADIAEQNPRALWISLEREAQDGDYVKKASQTSGITQKEHKQVAPKTVIDSLATSALGDAYSFLAEKFPSIANKDISQIIDEARDKNNALDSNLQAAIQGGQSYDEFVAKNGQDGVNRIKDTMDIYRGEADENYFSQSIDGLVSLILPINTYTDSQAKKEYESRQKEYELYHKPLDEWSEQDYTFMRYRKDDLWDKISSTFTGQGDEAKKQALANEWKKEYENQQNKIFSNDLKKALLYFENISQATSVAEVGKTAINAAFNKELKHDKDKLAEHNKNLSTLARGFGFDEAFLDTKTHKTIFVKGEEAWEASPDAGQIFSTMLKANLGTMAGGTAGAIATAKAFAKGGNLKTKAIAGLGGAALGSFLGAGLDVKLENFINNRESNFDEMLAHMTQEGVLAVATPLAISGAAKTLKGGAKAIAKVSQATSEALTKGELGQSTKGLFDSSKAFFGKILDYTPMGNVIKNIADGNATAVRRLMNATIPKEEREALRASIKDFGLELELNPKSAQALESLSTKYGDKHPRIIQAAQTVHNAFSLPSGKAIQEELLSAMRADNTGSLYGFLVEVANQTPQLQKSLHEILNQTHARALRELRAVGASPSDIKAVFDSYKQGIEEGYAKSFEVLSDIFSKDITTTIDKSAFETLTTELKDNVIDPAALNYLKVVEKRIYESNRSFDNLKDALSLLNEQWKKHAKNLGFSGEKLRRVEKQMRDDIKRGIYDLFEQMPHARDFRELFDTALRDYSTMKGLMGDIKDLKLQSTKIEFEKSLDKLFNFLKAGQADTLESISNLKLLTQNLPAEAKTKFEIGVLNHLMEKSVFSAKNGDNVVLEVFNSGAFLERLEQIKGGFSTSQAKQYIDFVKDFHKLYKNDYLIGTRTLDPAIIKKAGGGIATTPEGRFAYQRAKFIYENILRLMPTIPFLRTFNESVSGAAVRFHLKSALQKSASVGELRRSLDFKVKNGNFNNATKEVLAKITKEVDEGAQNIARAQAQETQNLENVNNGSDIGGNTRGKVDNVETLANNRQQPAQTLDNEIISQNATPHQALESLNQTQATQMPSKISINEFMQSLDEVGNKANFIEHLLSKGDAEQRIAMLNLVEPTLKNPDIIAQVVENGIKKQKHIKKFSDGKEFFYLLASKENGSVLLTGFKTNRLNTIEKELENADIIQTFIRQGSKQEENSRFGLPSDEIVSQQAQNSPKSILESAKKSISETEALEQDFQHLLKEAQNLKRRDIQAREANEKKMIDNLDAREARIKKQAEQELGRSLDEEKIYYELYQTGKIKYKQLGEMQQEIREAYWDWWEKQIEKGNKELLQYNKDVDAYHKATSSLIGDKNMQQEVDEFKNWQKEHLHEMTNRTDKQIIAEQMKKMDKSYDEVKETLRFARRQMELRLNLYPLSEFGTNYAEFYQDGKGAIAKLISEANAAKEAGQDFSGQVAGAFYRDDLGEITLAWGDSNFGLKHILEKRSAEFGEQKALDFVEKIPEIIEKGKLINQNNVRYRVEYDDFVVGLSAKYKDEEQNFIITAFEKKGNADFFSEPHFNPTSHNAVENPDEKIIPPLTQNSPKSILESAKKSKKAQKEAKELAQKQADEKFYARYNAEKARQEAIIAQRESSEGLSDLAAHEANFSFEADIPTKQLQSTTIALNKDEIYPAHFVIVHKDDLKPRFIKGNFQFKQGMKADEVQSVANDFKPELLFEKSGEYEGLPLIARDGQIIAGNHRAQGIKDFSQESLKKHQEYAKAKFGVELAPNEVIVRQIDKDVPLHTQLRLAQASNAGNANNRLGEQILSDTGKAQPYIENLPHKIQADSFETLQSAVANALNMPNAPEAANRALFAHLAKGTGSKDLISILDKPRNNALDDIIKAQELYFKNAGEFYNLSKNTALNPELNLNDYLLQALDSTLSLAGKERGQVFKQLSDDINDFIATGGGSLGDMISNQAQIKTFKGRVLGAGIAKYANQNEGGASQLNKVLRDLPDELAEEFSPSLTNPSGKALKDVDMYDFLDYFIRVTKHNNNSVSELAQSLQALREFEKGGAKNADIMSPEKIQKGQNQMTETLNVQTQNAEFKTLKTQLDNKLKKLKEVTFINEETQIKATIANTGIKEIISNVRKSVENGFDFRQHFAVAMDLENVFRNAKFQSKNIDTKHNDPNVMIYRFVSPVLLDDKTQANALLTLKEWKENGKRIYALKLENLEK